MRSSAARIEANARIAPSGFAMSWATPSARNPSACIRRARASSAGAVGSSGTGRSSGAGTLADTASVVRAGRSIVRGGLVSREPGVRSAICRSSAYDLIEINEAFAAQALADGRELGFDWSKVNVNGGAIALGHPIGASGARIVATLLHELKRRGGRYGMATLCLGGGGSVAMAFERV